MAPTARIAGSRVTSQHHRGLDAAEAARHLERAARAAQRPRLAHEIEARVDARLLEPALAGASRRRSASIASTVSITAGGAERVAGLRLGAEDRRRAAAEERRSPSASERSLASVAVPCAWTTSTSCGASPAAASARARGEREPLAPVVRQRSRCRRRWPRRARRARRRSTRQRAR
jgi:hypothetical protein